MQPFKSVLALLVAGILSSLNSAVSSDAATPSTPRAIIPIVAANARLGLVDLATNDRLYSLKWDPVFPTAQVVAVTCSTNGRFLACIDSTMRVRVWNRETKYLHAELQAGSESRIGMGLALSANGALVATCEGRCRPVLLFEASSGKLVQKLAVRRDEEIRTTIIGAPRIGFSPKGNLVACTASNLHIWNSHTGEEVLNDNSQVFFAAFSPDERYVFGYGISIFESQEVIRIHPTMFFWDLKTGRRMERVLRDESGGFDAFDLSPGEPYCVTAGPCGLVRLWDLYTGKELSRSNERVPHKDKAVAIFSGPTAFRFATVRGAEVQCRTFPELSTSPVLLTKETLQDNWASLADPDPLQAYSAFEFFRSNLKGTVGFLKNPTFDYSLPNKAKALKLLSEMDSGAYATRELATAAAKSFKKQIRPSLIEKFATRPSPELKRRIEAVLNLEDEFLEPGELRRLRRLSILEE